MKIIEKIALIIYSIIVLILSVVCCLLIFNWLQLDSIINILENIYIIVFKMYIFWK